MVQSPILYALSTQWETFCCDTVSSSQYHPNWFFSHDFKHRLCAVTSSKYTNKVADNYNTQIPSVSGEMIKVVMEDYIQHMSGFKFKLLYEPDLMHETGFSYHNQVHIEFQLLYRWHALVPDYLRINGTPYSIPNLLFNPKPFVDAGLESVIKSFTKQFAGKVMFLCFSLLQTFYVQQRNKHTYFSLTSCWLFAEETVIYLITDNK